MKSTQERGDQGSIIDLYVMHIQGEPRAERLADSYARLQSKRAELSSV